MIAQGNRQRPSWPLTVNDRTMAGIETTDNLGSLAKILDLTESSPKQTTNYTQAAIISGSYFHILKDNEG